jgi:hypothetical protein
MPPDRGAVVVAPSYPKTIIATPTGSCRLRAIILGSHYRSGRHRDAFGLGSRRRCAFGFRIDRRARELKPSSPRTARWAPKTRAS